MDHDPVPGGAESRVETNCRAGSPASTVPSDADAHAGRGRTAFGSVLLFFGIGLLGLLLIDPGELPVSMPRSWYIDRTLWVAGGLISLATGWHLLRDSEDGADGDRERTSRSMPKRAAESPVEGLGPVGPRFSKVVLYTRSGCHLCDDAHAMLAKYSAFLPPIVPVDIDADDDHIMLIMRFSACVPVVEIDGKVRFRGHINEVLLRRLIAAQPSVHTTHSTDVL